MKVKLKRSLSSLNKYSFVSLQFLILSLLKNEQNNKKSTREKRKTAPPKVGGGRQQDEKKVYRFPNAPNRSLRVTSMVSPAVQKNHGQFCFSWPYIHLFATLGKQMHFVFHFGGNLFALALTLARSLPPSLTRSRSLALARSRSLPLRSRSHALSLSRSRASSEHFSRH